MTPVKITFPHKIKYKEIAFPFCIPESISIQMITSDQTPYIEIFYNEQVYKYYLLMPQQDNNADLTPSELFDVRTKQVMEACFKMIEAIKNNPDVIK